jgi:hypothetical protein
MYRAYRLTPAIVLLLTANLVAGEKPVIVQPVKVEIRDEKPVAVEPVLPLDPAKYVQIQSQGNMFVQIRVENKTLHLGFIQTTFKIDGQVLAPPGGGRFEYNNRRLPNRANGSPRDGFESLFVHGNGLNIRQVIESAATKPGEKPVEGQKRRVDAAMITYEITNKDKQAHEVGLRVFMDMYCVDNDGAVYAAPTHPGKILDGVELKGKEVPKYVQVLQRPNLQNPGFVAHFTYAFGKQFEMPTRVVLTSLGAQRDNWEVTAQQANGDSAMAFYWEPKVIPPGGKRQFAYAYGQGLAITPENEGHVNIVLGGSFEPGKEFTIAAYVSDPAPGQALMLELPAGMQRLEGAERQPVPFSDEGQALVLWKARVLQTGEFPLRVHSNTGVTQTKLISIRR